MTDKGREFEREIAKELGLSLVPGSGNQWYSKLDLKGQTARWSLKFTEKDRFSVSKDFIDEATHITGGLSGDGRIPVWLLRLEDEEYDLVILRKEDFKAMQAGEIKILSEDKGPTKAQVRKEKARVPRLLREE